MQNPVAEDHAISEFIRKRRNQKIVLAVIVLAIFTGLGSGTVAGWLNIGRMDVVIGAGAVIGALIVYSRFNWRCPVCNGYLGQEFNVKVCKECGKAFLAAEDSKGI